MNTETIKNTIGYKKDKIALLKQKQQLLIDLEKEISVSSFKKTIQSVYYKTKRFVVYFGLLLVSLLIVVALVSPSVLFLNQDGYTNNFITDYKDNYREITTKTVDQSFQEVQKNPKANLKVLEQNIDKSVTEAVVKSVETNIRLSVIGLIIIVLLLLYVIRVTRKLNERSQLVAKTDKLTKEIIADYNLIIEEEEREITDLNNKLT